MSDLIDRQAAVDALKTDMASLDHIIKGMSAYDVRLDAYVSQRNQVDCDIDTISNLPPAQPIQRTGKWNDCDPICPVCGEDKFKDLDADIWADWKPKFCPNCGAKMEGDAE